MGRLVGRDLVHNCQVIVAGPLSHVAAHAPFNTLTNNTAETRQQASS